jgi:glycosyltransferase involved in cell wall biosynthesis
VKNNVDSLVKALQSLCALSDAERVQMGENGKRLIQEKYTWPAVAKQMIRAYKRLLHE